MSIRPRGEHHGAQQEPGRRIQLGRGHSRHRLLERSRFRRLALFLGLRPFLVKIPGYCARTDQSGILQRAFGHKGAQQRPQGAGTHQAANAARSSLGQTGCLFFGRIHKRAKRFTNVLFIEDVEKGHMNLSCCCLAQRDFPYIPLCVNSVCQSTDRIMPL